MRRVAAALVACAALAMGANSHASEGKVRGRPNIVVIQSDDQVLSQFARSVMPRTERLLLRHGTRFSDYIATTAQCCPSRASLLTGQYPHNHGVRSNAGGYQALIHKSNVLPVWLQRSGYQTMHVGKFLTTRGLRVAPGWSEWYTALGPAAHYYGYKFSVNGHLRHYGHRRKDNITHVLGRDAARLVDTHAPRRRPFYLQLDERAPHVGLQNDPFGACDHAPIPEPRDESRFTTKRLPRPVSFDEADLSDKPRFLSALPKLKGAAEHQLRKHWRCAVASLAGLDRNVAKVYRAVKRAGELTRTVFMFISDNGVFFGEHRIRSGKVLPYEEALHLPLVIRMPKRYRHGAKRVAKVEVAVGNIDLAPTILNLAHARPCSRHGHCRTMDGRSLMPLLTRSGAWPRDRGLLTEYRVADAGRYATCEFTGIRTSDNIYVVHSRVVNPDTSKCIPADERERYDLKRDPFELNNLCFGGSPANCPADAEQLNVQRRLSRLQNCAGIAGRDYHVNGRPFCE
jgi:N-acetylglucosamine-6-sulfatase